MSIIAVELGLSVSQSPYLNHPPKLEGLLGSYVLKSTYRTAHLLRFGNGVLRPRRSIVDLTKSTFDGFHDGSKDFLKLSRLLSQIHSNVCATLGDTFGKEISGPHIDVLLDPKHLLPKWDMGASFD
jgi:hypothetical protein